MVVNYFSSGKLNNINWMKEMILSNENYLWLVLNAVGYVLTSYYYIIIYENCLWLVMNAGGETSVIHLGVSRERYTCFL